jgi:hypothetical protein
MFFQNRINGYLETLSRLQPIFSSDLSYRFDYASFSGFEHVVLRGIYGKVCFTKLKQVQIWRILIRWRLIYGIVFLAKVKLSQNHTQKVNP